MKPVGLYLREARLKKKFSLVRLEEITRIKRDFLEAIEKENWDVLPVFSVVTGFVKIVAKALDLDENQATAFLRRDYPPKKININPKKDVSDHFSWTPRLTFIAGIVIVLALVLGYLGYEYINFISPPKLTVENPQEGQTLTRQFYLVTGKVSPGSTVTVNNQQANVEDNGKFESQIEVSKELREIVVVATSRSGKVTTIRRTINPELK